MISARAKQRTIAEAIAITALVLRFIAMSIVLLVLEIFLRLWFLCFINKNNFVQLWIHCCMSDLPVFLPFVKTGITFRFFVIVDQFNGLMCAVFERHHISDFKIESSHVSRPRLVVRAVASSG